MRATGSLPDAAQVLLGRFAMAREPGPGRPRPGRQTLVNPGRPLTPILASGANAWPAGTTRTDHDLIRVWDGGVQQLDLEADHRMEPGRLGRVDEADRAIQPGMIGDGQRGETKLHGSIDELVGCGCAVEEREVGVAVELGVTELSHRVTWPDRLTEGSP